MFKSFQVVFLYFLLELSINCAEKYKICNPHSLEGDCPAKSNCNQLNETGGECRCIPQYEVNQNYMKNGNATEYCIFNPTATPPPIPSKSASSSAAVSEKSISQHEPPSHHIVSGILIPIFLVLIVIGVVFTVKKTNLMGRARELLTRRSRPVWTHVDVMMNNDNDDPPLI